MKPTAVIAVAGLPRSTQVPGSESKWLIMTASARVFIVIQITNLGDKHQELQPREF
jgi:hypothetical protein